MRRKRKKNKTLAAIAVLLALCLLAGLSIVGTVKKRAADAREAEIAEQKAAEAAAQEEEAKQKEETAKKSERIFAYRGSSEDGLYTMASYENAVEAGAGTIVVPFVVSQDGTLFVADDDYAQELTGYGGYFSGMVDSQIDNLETKSGTKVLKVSEVFDKFGTDVKYVLDLRYTSERNQEALRKFLEENGNEDVISVACNYFSGLRALESSLPDVTKIFMCQDEASYNEARFADYVDTISVNKDMMSEELCKGAHEYDKKFSAWSLNSAEDVKKAIDIGADFFFTDEVAVAVEAEGGSEE